MWVSHIQSVKNITIKDWLPPKKKEFYQQTASASDFPLVSSLMAYNVDFRIAKPSQLYKPIFKNKHLYIDTYPVGSISLGNPDKYSFYHQPIFNLIPIFKSTIETTDKTKTRFFLFETFTKSKNNCNLDKWKYSVLCGGAH